MILTKHIRFFLINSIFLLFLLLLHTSAAFSSSVIWSDDFSIPTKWTITDNSGSGDKWVIGSTCPSGPYKISCISSETSYNGFALFDSDLLCNNSSNFSQNSDLITTNPINLTGFPLVNLEFKQYYRHYSGKTTIGVSTNNVDWTEFPVNSTLQQNDATMNSEKVSVNISSVAGNKSSVWIKFNYQGDCDYAWMIDDVKILNGSINDLAITEIYLHGSSNPYSYHYYNKIPYRQAIKDKLTFGAKINNPGIASTNLFYKLTITEESSSYIRDTIILFSDTIPALNAMDSVTIDLPNDYYLSKKGNYYLTFRVYSDSTDANTLNDYKSVYITVTDSVYSWSSESTYNGTGIWYGDNVKWQCLSKYEIFTSDTLTSLSFYFMESTPVNSSVNFHVYDSSLSSPIVSVLNYKLTASKISTWMSVPFPKTVINPGRYYVGFESISDSVLIYSPTGTTVIPPGTIVDNIGSGWTSADYIPHIRMNLKTDCSDFMLDTLNIKKVSCLGNDGALSVRTMGGKSSFAYTWNVPEFNVYNFSYTFTNLKPGFYSVTVTDASNCRKSLSIPLENKPEISVNPFVQDDSCSRGTGIVHLNATGGTPPYTYYWFNRNEKNDSLINIPPGSYVYKITDSKGCKLTDTILVNNYSTNLRIESTVLQQESSCGSYDGSVTVITNGGADSLWMVCYRNDSFFRMFSNNSIDSLTSGYYKIIVNDEQNCMDSAIFVLNSLNGFSVDIIDSGMVSCKKVTNGYATVAATGGNEPYFYKWDNVSGYNQPTLTNLPAGHHFVEVWDNSTCRIFHTIFISEPEAMYSEISFQNITCKGLADGGASLTATGGVPPYYYSWNTFPVQTTETVDNLSPGMYIVTVTDSKNCTQSALVSITEPTATPATVYSTLVHESCKGNDGKITLNVTGGTLPYEYSWSNYTSNKDNDSLTAGNYEVTITDGSTCKIIKNFVIQAPVLSQSVQCQEWSWANVPGNGNNYDVAEKVTFDKNGNVCVTGSFLSPYLYSNSDTLWNNGREDILVIKYSGDGQVLWSRNFGGAMDDNGKDITTDLNGNIFVTGNFYGTVYFGNIKLSASVSNKSDIFIIKMGPDGNIIWAKSFGGTDYDEGYSVETDTKGNIYLGASYSSGYFYVGSTQVINTSYWDYDVFIAKLNNSGTVLWVKEMKGDDDEYIQDIATDNNDNVFVTGYFTSPTMTTQTTTLSNAGKSAIFFAKYNSNGTLQWAKSSGGSDENKGQGVTTDLNGNVYFTGYFESPGISFDNITVTNKGSANIFIAKYDNNGNALKAKGEGGTGWDRGMSVALDSAGNLYGAGIFRSPEIILGNYTFTGTGYENFFIVKYDTAWNVINSKTIGGNISKTGNSVAIDAASNGVVCGQLTTGCGVFGQQIMLSGGMYVAAFPPVDLNLSLTKTNVTCNGGANGSSTAEVAGGTTPYTYYWSNGGSNGTAVNLAKGNYTVTVADANGCLAMASIQITDALNPPTLCLVSVDSMVRKNLIVWEKRGDLPAYYNIYKEGISAGVYEKIGTVPRDSASEFIDMNSVPMVKSDKYKITAEDQCSNESPLSSYHRTVHLSASQGVPNGVNLIWNAYEGFPFGTYTIWRGSSVSGVDSITSVPSNVFMYTDVDPPAYDSLFYIIGAVRVGGCNSALRGKNYNSSKSNTAKYKPSTTMITPTVDYRKPELIINPNPVRNIFDIYGFLGEEPLYIQIHLIDLLGNIIYSSKYIPENKFISEKLDISGFSSGVYLLQIFAGSDINYIKIIKL